MSERSYHVLVEKVHPMYITTAQSSFKRHPKIDLVSFVQKTESVTLFRYRMSGRGAGGHWIYPSQWNHCNFSVHNSVTKSVVCAILSAGWCI